MSESADRPNRGDPSLSAPAPSRHPFTYRAPAEPTADEGRARRHPAEETRRNDTVLLVAALLMGVLFACTTLADSQILVHIATGQYLATHGILPPATDVFSATAQGERWINLAWLTDLGMAGLYAIGGAPALTILQVIGALGTLLLVVGCHHRGVSTWWSSLVVVLAVVAMMPQLQAGPVLITLLGLALTLWLVRRYRDDGDDKSLWWLIPLFALWANLDPRMFLGLAVLVLYGLGELFGLLMKRPAFEDDPRRWRYWLAAGGALLASLLNPSVWHAPAAAWRLYGRIDPAFRQHYGEGFNWEAMPHLPLFSLPPDGWLDISLLAALLLGTVALVTLVLNRRRIDLGEAVLWAGFAGFGMLAGREWPAAAVVFAVIAIRNAESWYRSTFQQATTGDWSELFFSRGGRALTVLAFFALATLWMSGRIIPDDGRRPGVGLDPVLANHLDSLSRVLADAPDRRVFNFHLGQGDELIWLGYRPFIDHRLGLYASGGSEGDRRLIRTHRQVRRALRLPAGDGSGGEDPADWKEVLAEYGIRQAVPPLTFPRPDYDAYFDLLKRPGWHLARLGGAGALFYYLDQPRSERQAFLAEHGTNFIEQAFRTAEPVPETPSVWAQPRGWIEAVMRGEPVPNPLARARHIARHYEAMKAGALGIPPRIAIAMAHVGIRDCYRVLAEDPNSARAYRTLGLLFEMLYIHEQQLLDVRSVRRLFQAIGAYGQSLRIEPHNPRTYEHLVGLYLAFNRFDLAVRAREKYEELAGRELPTPSDAALAQRVEDVWKQIDERINRVTEQTRANIESGQPPLAAANAAWQAGCTVLALDLLNKHADRIKKNPAGILLKAKCLLEAARPRQAHQLLVELQQSFPAAAGAPGWRVPLALATLALPNFEKAGQLYGKQAEDYVVSQMLGAMKAAALVGQVRGFPILQTNKIWQSMTSWTRRVANQRLNAALCALDAGDLDTAEKRLDHLLREAPLTLYTPLAGFYLEQIRGEPATIDLSKPESSDPYAQTRQRLDNEIVMENLTQAGPKVAPKPSPGHLADPP